MTVNQKMLVRTGKKNVCGRGVSWSSVPRDRGDDVIYMFCSVLLDLVIIRQVYNLFKGLWNKFLGFMQETIKTPWFNIKNVILKLKNCNLNTNQKCPIYRWHLNFKQKCLIYRWHLNTNQKCSIYRWHLNFKQKVQILNRPTI